MRLVLTEDHPTLKTYDQDRWAALPDAASPTLEPSLAIVRGLHRRWVELLRAVAPEAWTRTAHHPERGTMSLGDLLTMYADHGRNHVAQIRGLRQRRGW